MNVYPFVVFPFSQADKKRAARKKLPLLARQAVYREKDRCMSGVN
jgi:hypothetical protein